ncbi:hypothetical protein RBB78_21610 [Tunturiibacter empetritectus]|uniref:hypothetical protein n=1 Tax=Tunturiibacter empetritectus TaxID=3069691 RepID=UPI003D9AFD39
MKRQNNFEAGADVRRRMRSKKSANWKRRGVVSGTMLITAAATMRAGKSDTIAE